MKAKDIFFSLLRLGVGLTESIELPEMNRRLWHGMFRAAEKHSVAGIMMDAVHAMPDDVRKPDRDLMLKLMALNNEIEKKNRTMNSEVVKWSDFFREKGFRSVLLKGQGVACLYPNPMRRMSGDIDLWVIGNASEVRRIAREELGAKYFTYHHIDVDDDEDTVLEVHTTPSWMYSYPKNRRLQRMFRQWEDSCQEAELQDAGRILVPSDEMNRVFLLLHMYRHVFSEGIGLRQMMDYALLLNRGCGDDDKAVFVRYMRDLNMYGFAEAVMYVMKRVFGLKDECLLVEPDEVKGEKLLDSIMKGGNFGKHDSSIDRTIKSDSVMSFLTRNRRNLKLLKDYPEEVLWGPVFKIWHWVWRYFKNIR